MTTLAELGIPFPLYEGAVEGSEYVGISHCSVCGRKERHSFHLSKGANIMVPCPSCSTPISFNAESRKAEVCIRCNALIPPPKVYADPSSDTWCVCYQCLCLGRAAKDTECGLVTWEQAVLGQKHPIPWLPQSPLPGIEEIHVESATHNGKRGSDRDWYAVRLLAAAF